MKKTKIPIYLIALSAVLFFVDLVTGFFGKFINTFFPCSDPLGASAPCYVNYDVQFGFVLGGIFILSLLTIIITKIIGHKSQF